MNNPFQSMCDVLDNPNPLESKSLWPGERQVTVESYAEFRRQWVVDALRGWRYGQSFCHYFGVPNASPLYWFKDTNISRRWIRDNYLNDEAKVY